MKSSLVGGGFVEETQKSGKQILVFFFEILSHLTVFLVFLSKLLHNSSMINFSSPSVISPGLTRKKIIKATKGIMNNSDVTRASKLLSPGAIIENDAAAKKLCLDANKKMCNNPKIDSRGK